MRIRIRPNKPANQVRDFHRQALSRDDMTDEVTMKRAEERIAAHMGERLAAGARWMLRRLRMRRFRK